MSTRSAIGIKYQNNEVKVIYCHSDGYPEWNGAVLNAHYRSVSKVDKLISLGYISSLGEKVDVPMGNPYAHDLQNRLPHVTLAYHRDCKLKKDKPVKVKFSEIDNLDFNASYLYLFDVSNEKWLTYEVGKKKGGKYGWVIKNVNYEPLILEQVLDGDMLKPQGYGDEYKTLRKYSVDLKVNSNIYRYDRLVRIEEKTYYSNNLNKIQQEVFSYIFFNNLQRNEWSSVEVKDRNGKVVGEITYDDYEKRY